MRVRAAAYWTVFALVTVPAGVLTLVRLTDPTSTRGVQLQAFTTLALPLYAVALLLVGAGLVLRAGRGRLAMLAPGGLALAGLLVHLWWFAPLVTGSTPAPDRGAELTVMSSNLLGGGGDGAELVREAAERDVDVLVAIEVTRRTVDRMEQAGLSDLFPYRVGEPGSGVEGTMVFARRPLALTQPLGTRFEGMLVTTEDGATVLAAHPVAPTQPRLWRADHAVLLDAVRRLDPDVVVGDLNATLDQPPMRALEAAGYRDTAELLDAGLQATWPANGKFPLLGLFPPSAAIDHVLVSSSWTAVATGTADIADTDHRAVVATVAPRAP